MSLITAIVKTEGTALPLGTVLGLLLKFMTIDINSAEGRIHHYSADNTHMEGCHFNLHPDVTWKWHIPMDFYF